MEIPHSPALVIHTTNIHVEEGVDVAINESNVFRRDLELEDIEEILSLLLFVCLLKVF